MAELVMGFEGDQDRRMVTRAHDEMDHADTEFAKREFPWLTCDSATLMIPSYWTMGL